MQSFVRAAVVGVVVLLGSQSLAAGEAIASPPVPAIVGAGPAIKLPLVVGQTTSNQTSGSRSYRIPRGLIRLAIFGGIALVGAAGWAFKKMTAGS
jgi:hypothetical protein